jgi:hypothetical protein
MKSIFSTSVLLVRLLFSAFIYMLRNMFSKLSKKDTKIHVPYRSPCPCRPSDKYRYRYCAHLAFSNAHITGWRRRVSIQLPRGDGGLTVRQAAALSVHLADDAMLCPRGHPGYFPFHSIHVNHQIRVGLKKKEPKLDKPPRASRSSLFLWLKKRAGEFGASRELVRDSIQQQFIKKI